MTRWAVWSLVLCACGGGGGGGGPGGGGDCNQPGTMGMLTFTVQGMQFVDDCFDGTNTGGTLDMASPHPREGQTAITLDFYFKQTDDDTQAPCNWGANVTKPLTSGCLTVTASHDTYSAQTGMLTSDWQVLGGSLELSAYPSSPQPTGSVTVTSWATGPNQTFLVEMSSDATLLYPSGYMGNTGPDALVPVSGMAGMTTGS